MKSELNETSYVKIITKIFGKHPELAMYGPFNRSFDRAVLHNKKYLDAFNVSLDFFESVMPHWEEPASFFFTISPHLRAAAGKRAIPPGIALAAAVYLGCTVIGEECKNNLGRIREYRIIPPKRKAL